MPTTPSSSSALHSGEGDAICEHCGSNTGLERIDGTKLNDLLDTVRGRLCRDAHGNFFIEGAKTGKDTRHGQLGDLFTLLGNLEGFKTTMDRYIALHAPKPVVKPEKTATINQNQTAAIEAIVEKQVANRIRDLQIRCDRLEVENRMAKSALDKAGLYDVKDARTAKKLASSGGGTVMASMIAQQNHEASAAELRSLKASVEGLEIRQSCQDEKIDGAMSKLKGWNASVGKWDADFKRRMKQVEGAVAKLHITVDEIKKQKTGKAGSVSDGVIDLLDGALTRLQIWQADMDEWKLRKNAQVNILEADAEDVQTVVTGMKETVRSVSASQGCLDEWKLKIEEDVQMLWDALD